MDKRRKKDGVAIVTVRASYIKARCLAASIPARPVPVQPGPSWPEHRSPVVLDTVGLPVEDLVALLANPPKVKPQPAARVNARPVAREHAPKENAPLAPIAALADADDWRTLRLLAICPSVGLIGPEDPAFLRGWIRHLAVVQVPRRRETLPACFIPSPPLLRLDPLLLRALAALHVSPSVRAAAERCAVSESTMSRLLRATRDVLGMPPGDMSRFRPADLAAMILERLGADQPHADNQSRRDSPTSPRQAPVSESPPSQSPPT